MPRVRRSAPLAVLGILALSWLAASPALAQEEHLHAATLDPVLHHIGDGLYGDQCGFAELNRIGLWGGRYAIDFVTSRQIGLQIQLERVWGVAAGRVDRVLVDGKEVGWLPPNQSPNHPRCGASWTSKPFALEAGRHVLSFVSGRLKKGIDDVAFHGVILLAKREGAVLWYGKGRVSHTAVGRSASRGWMEVLMDTTTLVATFGLLAFMVERLTNGIAIVLGYWGWWRERMEVSATVDPHAQGQIERNRRVVLFALSALLAVVGALLVKLNLLASLGLGSAQSVGGQVLTGLLIASGADPIREVLKLRERGRETPSQSPPIQLTGMLILQQAPVASAEQGEAESG
ncbi:MAG: hypothetical protein ACE5IQ_09865 [Candidatus Methylomirabilales bacterium]